ncbi:hypothetical protein ABRZ04_13610 [Castellaniella ginsengisoli]|uniref:Uncharacterized protein n=2 Tax=Castellaniella ginsengisoli TaxID=546114 RepID=A0AB39CYI6_9BURK
MITATSALAFQVLPRISDVDRKLTGVSSHGWVDVAGQWFFGGLVPMIKHPVHEAIALSALGCAVSKGEEADCVTLERVREHQVLLYGVRWPDDPPFALNRASPPRISGCDPRVTLRSTAQPKCWYGLFKDADKSAKLQMQSKPGQPVFGPGDYLLYRSHFGDLQFFHSMAAYDGEPAEETLYRMRMWARFLWGLATKEIRTDQFIRFLGVDQLGQYFPGDMTATNLFATGIIEVRKHLDVVAMGVLLHMVQDSFSQAHTGRAVESGAVCERIPRFYQPGKITQFYSYAGQLGSEHDKEDTFQALKGQTLQVQPSVVDVSRAFLELWREGASWDLAEKYFDCAFTLESPLVKAGPGPYTH